MLSNKVVIVNKNTHFVTISPPAVRLGCSKLCNPGYDVMYFMSQIFSMKCKYIYF